MRTAAAMTARCLLVFLELVMEAVALAVGNGFNEDDAGERVFNEGDAGEREVDALDDEGGKSATILLGDDIMKKTYRMLEASGIVMALEGDLREITLLEKINQDVLIIPIYRCSSWRFLSGSSSGCGASVGKYDIPWLNVNENPALRRQCLACTG